MKLSMEPGADAVKGSPSTSTQINPSPSSGGKAAVGSVGTHKARPDHRSEVGRWGEERARIYLEGLGCEVVDRNWRTVDGELDLVVVDERRLVFVEVRTLGRGSRGLIRPEETVDGVKQRRVLAQAQRWLGKWGQSYRDRVWCFDVVGVRWPSGALVHIECAFEGAQ